MLLIYEMLHKYLNAQGHTYWVVIRIKPVSADDNNGYVFFTDESKALGPFCKIEFSIQIVMEGSFLN